MLWSLQQAKFSAWLCPTGVLARKHPGIQVLPPPPSHLLGSKRCIPNVLLMRNWHCSKSGSAEGKFTQLAKVTSWWGAAFLLTLTCSSSKTHSIIVYFWSNGVYVFLYLALPQPCNCRGCLHWHCVSGISEAFIYRFAKLTRSWYLCVSTWPVNCVDSFT